MSKTILKSNCKKVPADGVVRAKNKFEIHKCFTYWGGDRKRCNGDRKSFRKRSETLIKGHLWPNSWIK